MKLIYDRDSHQDFLVDSGGQLCFEFASYCNEICPNRPLSWPILKGFSEGVYGTNKLILRKNFGYIFRDLHLHPFYIKPENCCIFTGYFDVNGEPLYTKDYVKIDELGWCGFIFQEKDGISVRGAGGFSYYPSQIQRIGNPTLGQLTEDVARRIFSHEKEFMDENKIPFNFFLD